MTDKIKLTEWDLKAFKLVKTKHNILKIDDMKALWEERCMLPKGTAQSKYIVQYLFPIVLQMHPNGLMEILDWADPDKYPWSAKDMLPYWDMLLASLMGKMVLTPVVLIEGYAEFIQNNP